MRWFLTFFCVLQVGFLTAQTAENSFDKRIARGADSLACEVPDEERPVMLNAKLISDYGGDSVAVIIKACMAPGWHLYAYIPENMPYILTECLLESDANAKPVGAWIKSAPQASTTDKGVLIYEDVAVFTRKLKKTSKLIRGKISTGLYYQTCNLQQCLPPVEAKIELMY
ncbi:hypothetical protein IDJ77_22450 [Mucilaginibacter sp. ZT4R22]|uniref:Thiol:disulfide interchange protein DsbD N-terminal domain-containing protein n=1 Tax=Mucilaginibacter pankratovii TaxID=2772110 RepID=A0ABR7WYB5_9SPHI|nr:protein-disulfide reductase DsbD domain-containing protein [Mucilaginibacter pankratovii]MBD1366592.1 hypothetical protein [Mucilaginibacter pankratovii]